MTSLMTMKVDAARRFFFVEGDTSSDTFAIESWRGAVLDRDKYGWQRMPRILWDALRAASPDETWWICGYGNVGAPEPDAVSFSFDWDAFPVLPDNPAEYSSEWVAYNPSQTIAILADFDVTIVGAHPFIAAEVDRILGASGTSLRQLTVDDFGEEGEWGFITNLIRSALK